MGLFYEVLSAINNRDQQANVEQLKTLSESINKVAGEHDLDEPTTHSVLSALGEALRPALQQQAKSTGGTDQLGGILSQLAGDGSNNNALGGLLGQLTGGAGSLAALQRLVPQELQQQIIQGITQKTGLKAEMIQGMLPTLLPAVLGLLNMGASKPGTTPSQVNPILNAFLDSDRDGDVDLGDLVKFAGRFLGTSK